LDCNVVVLNVGPGHILLKPTAQIETHLVSTVAGTVRVHASLDDYWKKTKTFKNSLGMIGKICKGKIFLIGWYNFKICELEIEANLMIVQ